MAEQTEQDLAAQAPLEDDDETPGYKAPAPKTLQEIMEQDKEDESLQKYKETLLGAAENVIIDPNNPLSVIVTKLTVLIEGKKLDMDLTGDCENLTMTLKEGCTYRVQIHYFVQRDLVTGLKYKQVTTRKGIPVDKMDCMVGSYKPQKEEYLFNSQEEETPSGMIARGDYKVKSVFTDDDKKVYKQWTWTLKIKKDFD